MLSNLLNLFVQIGQTSFSSSYANRCEKFRFHASMGGTFYIYYRTTQYQREYYLLDSSECPKYGIFKHFVSYLSLTHSI